MSSPRIRFDAATSHDRRRPLAALVATVVVATTASGVARAQRRTQPREPASITEARERFSEGMDHAAHARWNDAERAFRLAMRLRPSPSTAFNLALTLGNLQRVIEADALLDQVLGDPATPRDLRIEASAARDRFRSAIGTLAVRLSGSDDGVRVWLDGTTIDVDEGDPRPIDPGTHEVVAIRDGHVVARERVAIGPTRRNVEITLVIPEPEPDQAPSTTPRAAASTIDEDEDGDTLTLVAGISLLGVGAVAGVTGTWALATDGDCAGGARDAEGDCEHLHERSLAGFASLLLATGAITAGTIVLFVLRDPDAPGERAYAGPRLGVVATPFAAGLSVSGRM